MAYVVQEEQAQKRRYEPWRKRQGPKAKGRLDGKKWRREQGRKEHQQANQQQQKKQDGGAPDQDRKEHSPSAEVERLKAQVEELRAKISATQRSQPGSDIRSYAPRLRLR